GSSNPPEPPWPGARHPRPGRARGWLRFCPAATMPPVTWSHSEGPMLEQHALLLRPWTRWAGRDPARANCDRIRPLLDAATGIGLGFACWRWPVGPAWWRWLRGPALAVYETEDASLLFGAAWSWVPLPRWQVRDADAHRVGTLRHWRKALPKGFGL